MSLADQPEYGNMKISRLSPYFVITEACLRVYLRIPSGPWRVPRPESYQPPIGISSPR